MPIGKYYGSIDKIELRPANDPTKFDQIQVAYLVTDGDHLGRKQSEFLSLSPKAAFRLKAWLNKFGDVDDQLELEFDDDSNLMKSPDLVASDVIFEVYQDPKLYQGEKQIRTRLVDVLDEDAAPVAAPVAKRAPVRRAAPVAVVEEAVEDDAEEGDPEEEAPAPAAIRRPLRSAPAATAAAPARRRLK